VQQPWYFRPWAIALYFVILFSLGFIFYSLRVQVLNNRYLKTIDTNRAQLFQIIAHDLKTPINNFSHLMGTIEFLIRSNRTKDLQSISFELNRSAQSVDLILNNLLNLSDKSLRSIQNDLSYINVKNIFFQVCNAYNLIAENKILSFKNDYFGATHFMSNELAISLFIRNIVDNAVKHASTSIEFKIFVNVAGTKMLCVLKNDFEPKQLDTLRIIQSRILQKKPIKSGEIGKGLGIVLISNSILQLDGTPKLEINSNQLVLKVLFCNKLP
jgi:signal transduction histidine kinase